LFKALLSCIIRTAKTSKGLSEPHDQHKRF
jgi:hypothetical protein